MLEAQMDPLMNTLMQINNGKTHVGEYLSLVFQNLPIGVFWKNKDLVIEGCNQFDANIAGLAHPEEMIGKTDFDLCWTEAESIGFRQDDQSVINGGQAKLNFIEYQHRSNGDCYPVCVTKLPLFNALKQVTGVVGFFSEISSTKNIHLLPNFCSNHFYQRFQEGENYYILKKKETMPIRLTTRQAECLTYLSMGKTIKQIANMLGCSSSTIEDHIARLKQKLNVYTTSALIDCFWHTPIRWF